jgi:DNA-binding winged helix-turn-helix (wHTH) protein
MNHLLNTIWAGANVVVNNLVRRVSDLRRNLGKSDSGQNYILTLPNRGYVLADVKELAKAVRLPGGFRIKPLLREERHHPSGNPV